MPKRILDGESLWSSRKLLSVQPASFRPEYANLLPLALRNGVFECDVRQVWSRVYAYNRPDVTADTVEAILNEFERVKLIFRWKVPATSNSGEQTWAFFVGIDRPGRLPSKSREDHEKGGPDVPHGKLAEFLGLTTESNGIQQEATGCVGLGLGQGSGIGKGQCKREKRSETPLDGFDVLSLKFPTKDAHYQLKAEDLKNWKILFPLVDVDQCLRSAKAWLDSNPNKRKTTAGMSRFLVDWLKRELSGKRTKTGFTHRENFEGIDYTTGVPEHALRYEKGEYVQAEVEQ